MNIYKKLPIGYTGCSLVFLIQLLAGCANFIVPQPGATVPAKDRISLAKALNEEKLFQTDDVNLVYTLSSEDDSYRFRGTLNFDRSITDSFEELIRFYLKMSFLDGEGRVLETIDVTPLYSKSSLADVTRKVARGGHMPQGATSIVFNYYGVFKGIMQDNKDDWDIHYFPFE